MNAPAKSVVGGERRFTMMDAMILVAASALAFGVFRPLVDGPLRPLPRWAGGLAFFILALLTFTPTALALRLKRPRPSPGRLFRQPGFAASIAGTTIIALGLMTVGLLAVIRMVKSGMVTASGRPALTPDPSWWSAVVLHFGVVVGPAVIAVWIVLAWSGRRRPMRNWLDFLGRIIGAGWIALFIINCCFHLSRVVE